MLVVLPAWRLASAGAALGITIEAATAADTIDAAVGFTYAAVIVEAATAADTLGGSVTAGFDGVLALDGPIIPGAAAPTVIYIEG